VRDLFGPGPGVVAATAYVFSPYVMYTLINRASFSEMVALAWMPWGVLALRRYALERRLACAIGNALIVATLLLSHTPHLLATQAATAAASTSRVAAPWR
jgi:hypothetical protein